MRPIFIGLKSAQGTMYFVNVNQIVQMLLVPNTSGQPLTKLTFSNGQGMDVNSTPEELLARISEIA